ncbi:TetR/AcrR family transcriptional regulator [Paenarthrobacter sp. DKR-5]|nr:TetR/AcrR family transcriptional regulator [Paenarthrobacter sp. DKR-5]MBT1003571.1 TetR/AcrR family transcriptional regulator [Paenarthrobacter sp. DKR-5]
MATHGEPAKAAPSRRPARTESTRQKLFDASMRLIGERGPGNVTVDEIAAAAGVSKGTVYYNFGSKSDLIAQLLEHGVELLEERMRTEDGDPLQALELTVAAALDFFADYPSFAQLLVSEMWRTPSEWRGTLTLLRERLVSIVADAVRRVAADQPVDPDVPVEGVVGAVFGATFILGLDRQVFHPERTRSEAVAAVMTIMRGYLRQN